MSEEETRRFHRDSYDSTLSAILTRLDSIDKNLVEGREKFEKLEARNSAVEKRVLVIGLGVIGAGGGLHVLIDLLKGSH